VEIERGVRLIDERGDMPDIHGLLDVGELPLFAQAFQESLRGLGLVLLMVGAAFTHRRRGELPLIGINATLLLVAVVVAWARFGPYPL